MRNLGSQVLSDSVGEYSSEQFSPLSELTGFRLTSDPCVASESEPVPMVASFDESFHHDVSKETDSSFHKMFDHNITAREGSSTDSDYLPNGVVDSGIVLPVGSGKEIVAQRHSLPGPAQEDDNLCMVDCVTTKREELDISIPPTTITSKKEPDEPSPGEITTAFSFLSYPQCGLYRRAFAQGYIDSGFHDMTFFH